MKVPAARACLLALALAAAASFSGCAATDPGNQKLEDRLQGYNAGYDNRLDRRVMRRDARDARYNAWFDSL